MTPLSKSKQRMETASQTTTVDSPDGTCSIRRGNRFLYNPPLHVSVTANFIESLNK